MDINIPDDTQMVEHDGVVYKLKTRCQCSTEEEPYAFRKSIESVARASIALVIKNELQPGQSRKFRTDHHLVDVKTSIWALGQSLYFQRGSHKLVGNSTQLNLFLRPISEPKAGDSNGIGSSKALDRGKNKYRENQQSNSQEKQPHTNTNLNKSPTKRSNIDETTPEKRKRTRTDGQHGENTSEESHRKYKGDKSTSMRQRRYLHAIRRSPRLLAASSTDTDSESDYVPSPLACGKDKYKQQAFGKHRTRKNTPSKHQGKGGCQPYLTENRPTGETKSRFITINK